MGRRGRPGFAGSASRVAELWAFCRGAACTQNAVRLDVRFAAPAARPIRGRPEPRPRRPGAALARRWRALCAALVASAGPRGRCRTPGARARAPDARRRERATPCFSGQSLTFIILRILLRTLMQQVRCQLTAS